MKYSVYEHIFPNGKKYIEMSKAPEERWNGGRGYVDNTEMFKDIVRFGWDNIEHRILMENLSREEAQTLESKLIVQEATYLSCNGYNRNLGNVQIANLLSTPRGKIFHAMESNDSKHYWVKVVWWICYSNHYSRSTCDDVEYRNIDAQKRSEICEKAWRWCEMLLHARDESELQFLLDEMLWVNPYNSYTGINGKSISRSMIDEWKHVGREIVKDYISLLLE